jgi:acyl homoserine lactone synthase
MAIGICFSWILRQVTVYLTTSEQIQTDSRIWNQQPLDNFFIEVELQLQKTPEFSEFVELVNRRKQNIVQTYPELAHGNLATLFEHPKAIEHTLNFPISTMIPKFWHSCLSIERRMHL